MLKFPQNLRHVSAPVGPSSGSMSSLAKVTLCTINMYTYVSDVGAYMLPHHLHKCTC